MMCIYHEDYHYARRRLNDIMSRSRSFVGGGEIFSWNYPQIVDGWMNMDH